MGDTEWLLVAGVARVLHVFPPGGDGSVMRRRRGEGGGKGRGCVLGGEGITGCARLGGGLGALCVGWYVHRTSYERMTDR